MYDRKYSRELPANNQSEIQSARLTTPEASVSEPVKAEPGQKAKFGSGFVDWWNNLDNSRKTALTSGLMSAGLKMMEAGGRSYATPVNALSIVGTGGLQGMEEYNRTLNRERRYGLELEQDKRGNEYMDIAKRQDVRAQGLYDAESPYFADIAQGRAKRFIQEERPVYPVTGGYVEVMPDGSRRFRSTVQDKKSSAFDKHKEVVQGFGYMLQELKIDNPRASKLGDQLTNPNLTPAERSKVFNEMFSVKGEDGKTIMESAEETARRVGGSTLEDFQRYKRMLLQSRSNYLNESERELEIFNNIPQGQGGLPLDEDEEISGGLGLRTGNAEEMSIREAVKNLETDMNSESNIRATARAEGISEEEVRERLKELLDSTNLNYRKKFGLSVK